MKPRSRNARRAEWTRVRGRAHVALANRGSRIALYDLRESIEAAASPLPVEFLAALSTAGDASCLEAIAAAYVRATAAVLANQEQGGWWRDHLAEAFSLIVRREGLTRRHAQVKKIEKRWGCGAGRSLGGRGGEGRKGWRGWGRRVGKRRRILFAWALLSLSVGAGAQDQTRFQSGVEVTSIDVTAVDRERTRDFRSDCRRLLRPDRRHLSTASSRPNGYRSPGRRVPITSVGTGKSGAPPDRGERLILLVIDQPNIRFGGAVGHRTAINSFVDRLEASDRGRHRQPRSRRQFGFLYDRIGIR